ncbi:MAG: hypothetical protein PHD15_02945 [Clostridia bacterium]|nr:hypothetical protein [Clostridia bacterium]MDD4386702.1 hypothetical protein [Clostridia bacterium]
MHVFNISFFVKNKLYVVVILAILIAFILIYVSFYSVIKSPIDNSLKQSDIFIGNSYFAEYEITDISNKNRNIYVMNEIYKKDGINEYFKFGYKDILGNDISYIVCNDRVKIENTSQISSYIINSNNFKKTNLFSLATYIDIINNIDSIKCMCLNVTEEEAIKKYELILDKQIHDTICTTEGICKYSDLFSNGLKLSKIELTISDNKPIDIMVYSNDNNVYINIKFIKFELNNEISDDIFEF